MAPSKNKQMIIVGIFFFIGIIILIAGIFLLSGQQKTFQKTILLHAVFTDVRGLLKGNNIWFAGTKIGTVRNINVTTDGMAVVELKLNKSAKHFVNKDAKAKIGSDGVIGNRIVIIYGGTPMFPVDNGDTLQTDAHVPTSDVINTFQESGKNLSTITGDIKVVSRRLVDGEGTVGRLLTNDSLSMRLEATALMLQRTATNIQSLTSNLADYTAKFNRKGVLANELVTDTTLYKTMKKAAADIRQASANTKELTDNLVQVSNDLKDTNNVAGVLLHDQETAYIIKASVDNIYCGTKKFDENMEALRHNFLFRRFFKKREKQQRAQQKKEACEPVVFSR